MGSSKVTPPPPPPGFEVIPPPPEGFQLIQSDTPTPEEAQQAQVGGLAGATGRFFTGVKRNLPSLESLKQLGAALVNPTGGLLSVGPDGKVQWGLPNVAKPYVAAAQGYGESLKQARSDLSQGNIVRGAAEAVPLLGTPTVHAFDEARSGNLAGAAGELASLYGPFAKLKVGGRVAEALETSAGKNVAQAVGARWQDVPDLVRNARYLSEGLGVGSHDTLLTRLKGKGALVSGKAAPDSLLGRAEAALARVKTAGANIPIDLMPVADSIRNATPRLHGPGGSGPISLDPQMIEALEKYAAMVEEKAMAHGTTPVFNPSTQTGVPGAPIPGDVPASEVFNMRSQAGHKASRSGAYRNNPLVEVSPEGHAAATTQGVLRDALEDAVPGLKKADFDYSTLRQVGDLLQVAAQKGTLKNAPTWQVMAARAGVRGTLGGIVGAGATGAGYMAGGLGGAGAAYGVFRIASEIVNSPWWQSLDAAAKLKVADAIRSGVLDTAISGTRAGTIAARSSIPPSKATTAAPSEE